ncbi:periplasmic binding protein [Purpureocillium lilacinum]|uniref:Periplasmic binding protein n=1 Tax=Purpureocillium lilacinum TaxID=33203 RepID=A0A179FKY5_PURLI|nr:periplasmic binding protein [Purpureocillium lilacinum]OAQ65669.1 periplasmic binding protein [Purpureocillium lilacinum]GJN81692.1 hypothetical protein PLIIFM63780_005227 [Purpureocillium lilacinum]
MHFSSTLSVLLASATACHAAFRPGCEDASWDSDTDYFLDKFDPKDENLPIAPTYNKTYVAIRNRQRRHVVLHCTNTPPPRSIVGEEALMVKVPVTSVAALDGFSQTVIEMLGMSSTIKRTGAYSDVTSSCIRGNMMNNVTYDDDHWDKADPVNVTFYGDWTREDKKSVLIYNNGMYSPLSQLAYIKFIAMFYGAEELANRVYDEIANNYRCAAAQVQQAFMSGDLRSGAFISPVQKDGDAFTVFQSEWWSALLSDAGSKLVNVSADGETANKRFGPKQVNLQANSDASEFAKQTWAIIDTTQYSQLPGKQAPKQSPSSERVDENSYAQRSGASSNSFAVKKNNVYLTDKATNRNLRHNFFDRSSARPDLALRDVISIVAPSLVPGYETSFIRSVKNPKEKTALIRKPDACPSTGKEVEALQLTQCDAPSWVKGYKTSGLTANAYARSDSVTSLAAGGDGDSGGLTGGQKAGIAVGTVCGVVLIAGAVVAAVLMKRRNTKKKQLKREMDQVEKGSTGSRSTR